MGGILGDQSFKSYSIFGITIFFPGKWRRHWYHLISYEIGTYIPRCWMKSDRPPHNKDPTYSGGGSDPPLWQPPFFLLYGELHFMDQRVFARREAAHTISSRSSRMPAGFQPISILDIRPPPEVKNHATWAKLTLSLLQDHHHPGNDWSSIFFFTQIDIL